MCSLTVYSFEGHTWTHSALVLELLARELERQGIEMEPAWAFFALFQLCQMPQRYNTNVELSDTVGLLTDWISIFPGAIRANWAASQGPLDRTMMSLFTLKETTQDTTSGLQTHPSMRKCSQALSPTPAPPTPPGQGTDPSTSPATLAAHKLSPDDSSQASAVPSHVSHARSPYPAQP